MSEFTIWARVSRLGPQEFVALASAIPLRSGVSIGDGDSVMETCATRAEAERARDRLAELLGMALRERGDTVLDVQIE